MMKIQEGIERMLKSDYSEIVVLYTDILLKQIGVEKTKDLLKTTDYRLVNENEKFFLVKRFMTVQQNGLSYTSPVGNNEEIFVLNYKDKKGKRSKELMFNNFLQPKKYLKYGNRRNVRK